MAEDTLIKFDNLRRVLSEYGQAVRNGYQDALIRSNSIASGELLNSLEFKVQQGERNFSVVLTLMDYWKYVEEGTSPHWPPSSAILKWLEVKPVIPRPDKNGKLPTPKQLAFLISRKIAREGTKGRHDLANTLEALNAEYMEKITAALAEDVRDAMTLIAYRPANR